MSSEEESQQPPIEIEDEKHKLLMLKEKALESLPSLKKAYFDLKLKLAETRAEAEALRGHENFLKQLLKENKTAIKASRAIVAVLGVPTLFIDINAANVRLGKNFSFHASDKIIGEGVGPGGPRFGIENANIVIAD